MSDGSGLERHLGRHSGQPTDALLVPPSPDRGRIVRIRRPAQSEDAIAIAVFVSAREPLSTIAPYREEIDYLIKSLAKVRQQVAFDTFEHMVACKILREGELLYGNGRVFDAVKALVDEHQIPAKLDAMQEHAARSRERAVTVLLDPPESLPDRQILTLFYTKEEGDEIF